MYVKCKGTHSFSAKNKKVLYTNYFAKNFFSSAHNLIMI